MQVGELPVAVIGGGPVGLAAGAHLVLRGETPIIFEAGSEVGANIRQWGHVRMFSTWEFNMDSASLQLLEKNGWQKPDIHALPSGDDLVDGYLQPLAQTPDLAPLIRLNTKVIAVSRRRTDKMKNAGRESDPFVLHVQSPQGEEMILARAVIDASGTWANPNPVGSGGLMAPGETGHSDRIYYGIPDVQGSQRNRYAGKRVAVVGGGHSAINVLLDLDALRKEAPGTEVHWILRKDNVSEAYGGQENDALPGRGLLGTRSEQMVARGELAVHTPFFVTHIEEAGEAIGIVGDTPVGSRRVTVDEIVATTGSRPDLEMLREVRLDLDPAVESPSVLAPLIDPNFHSCGTVRPHGEKELRQPEPNFYIVGMKSYGRAPTFLLATGYEQVRSVVAGVTGDWEAAADVQLTLPETGVCCVSTPDNGNGFEGISCCGTSPQTEENQEQLSCCGNGSEVAEIGLL